MFLERERLKGNSAVWSISKDRLYQQISATNLTSKQKDSEFISHCLCVAIMWFALHKCLQWYWLYNPFSLKVVQKRSLEILMDHTIKHITEFLSVTWGTATLADSQRHQPRTQLHIKDTSNTKPTSVSTPFTTMPKQFRRYLWWQTSVLYSLNWTQLLTRIFDSAMSWNTHWPCTSVFTPWKLLLMQILQIFH